MEIYDHETKETFYFNCSHANGEDVSGHLIHDLEETCGSYDSYDLSILISGFVLAVFQLLLVVLCCFEGRSSSRYLGWMRIVGNGLSLVGVAILVIVSWSLNPDTCLADSKYWLALKIMLVIDLVVAFIFSMISCFNFRKVGPCVDVPV